MKFYDASKVRAANVIRNVMAATGNAGTSGAPLMLRTMGEPREVRVVVCAQKTHTRTLKRVKNERGQMVRRVRFN